MRHYAAKQGIDYKWKYTCDGIATGYCAGSFESVWPAYAVADEDYDRWRANAAEFAQHYHDHAHETREEAQECYKKFLLDQRLYTNHSSRTTSLHRCQAPGCEEFTSGNMRIGGYSLFILCDEHRTRETLESLFTVDEAWES